MFSPVLACFILLCARTEARIGAKADRPWWYLGSDSETEVLSSTTTIMTTTTSVCLSTTTKSTSDSFPTADGIFFFDTKGPSALSFRERLAHGLQPHEVVIFTGGHSIQRRLKGYGKLSADSIKEFATHHGYNLKFLDELDYHKDLVYEGQKFNPTWHRVFALPALRAKFQRAKYFVWFDDDILLPYPTTDMLNHYINLMQEDPDWYMIYSEESESFVLNSGMFIMRNRDLAHDAYLQAMDIALERDGHLARSFGHEQEVIALVRARNSQ